MINFHNQEAEYLNLNPKNAKINHLIIAAHQDDAEIMAYYAIEKAYQNKKESVHTVILSNGSGSPRTGNYAGYTDEMMKNKRYEEQKEAARIGKYSSLTLLKYPSLLIKNQDEYLIQDLIRIIDYIRPNYIYIHNPFDKHPTHIASSIASLLAISECQCINSIEKVIGCEVWRGLDWLDESDKLIFDTSRRPKLALNLIKTFDSQTSGGKRYDLAMIGRWNANATFNSSHETDAYAACSYGIDLTSVAKKQKTLEAFVNDKLNKFVTTVKDGLKFK